MLAYKAWRESEVRMLVTAGALLWFCALFVLFRSGVGQIYEGALRYLFLVFVIVLGLGGLLQERARGSAAMTMRADVNEIE